MQKMVPKFPIAILIMAAGVVSTVYFHVDAKGVALLDSVGTDFRHFSFLTLTGRSDSGCWAWTDDFTGRNG